MKKYILNDKTIVLSGVTSGIGKELALKLINKYNCHVIGIGRSKEKMEKLKNELGEKQNLLTEHFFDVSKEESWKDFANELKEKDVKVDMLINNAGILPEFDKFENINLEDFRKIMQTNFMASVISCKCLLPILKQSQNPAIINVSSSISLCPLPGTTAYASSKSALKFFTESLIEEYRSSIYVAYVCPGTTRTEIFRNQNCEIEKIVQSFATSCDKITNKIIKKIIKRKRRIVVGFDAKLMDFFYRHFPRTFSHTCAKILKKSKIKMYQKVFKD